MLMLTSWPADPSSHDSHGSNLRSVGTGSSRTMFTIGFHAGVFRLTRGSWSAAGIAVIIPLLIAGCGGQRNPSATPSVAVEPTATAATTPADLPADAQSQAPALESMLARIPDVPGARRSLLITDVVKMRSFAGIEPPGPQAGQEKVADYLRELARSSTTSPETILPREDAWLAGMHDYALSSATLTSLGIDARNVDQVAVFSASTTPWATVSTEIVAGRYESGVIARRLEICLECRIPETIGYEGVEYWAWGGDMQQSLRDRLAPPAFDHLGRGGRIWAGDGFAVRTLTTAEMQAAIEAAVDKRLSLADDEAYVLAARALAELGAISAVFSSSGYSAPALFAWLKQGLAAPVVLTDEDGLWQNLTTGPLLVPFEVVAAGTAIDRSERYAAVVLVHDTPEAASTNAQRLAERVRSGVLPFEIIGREGEAATSGPPRWSDTIERSDVAVQGKVLIAKAYGIGPTSLVSLPGGGDLFQPLTVHE